MAFVAVLVVAAVAVVVIVNSDGGDSTPNNQVDGAFVSQMVPHHESAIEMAKVARVKAQHPQIINLANDIVSSQSGEIDQMNRIHQRLFGKPIDRQAHGGLGMDASMMGMDMDMSTLESAMPFDREFIDQMIPHHQGAIRMARAELGDGADQQTKALANRIIAAQSAEIVLMNEWRSKWYGSPSPAGGVPAADSGGESQSPDAMSAMDH